MRIILAVVAFLALSTVASAQMGGIINNGGGISKPIIPAAPVIPPTIFNATTVHGDDSYNPSLFICWARAVKYVPEPKPKTLGDIAREYREQKKAHTPAN